MAETRMPDAPQPGTPADASWSEAEGLAQALVAARREGRELAAASLPVPPDHRAAADVQSRITAALGETVASWKVGIGPDGRAVAAPMRPLVEGPSGEVTRPWHRRSGIEVELCFRLRHGTGPGDAATPEALMACVESVHLGIEITGGRLAEGNASPYLLFLADSLDNDGYVVGPALPTSVVAAVVAGEVPLTVSGAVTWSGPARHPQGHPLAPLAGVLAGGVWPPPGGALVTTGSFCGLVRVPAPGTIDVGFGEGTDHRAGMRLRLA